MSVILPLATCGGEYQPSQVPTAVSDSIFRPPPSIDASGTADVTSALNAFFAAVPDSSLVELPLGARYRIEGTLLFRDRHALTIDGNSATLFATTDGREAVPTPSFEHEWPRSRAHLAFVRGSQIVVRKVTVQGANPAAGSAKGAYVASLEAQHGFLFLGTRGVKLDRVTVTDIYGDFLYLGGLRGILSSDVHISRAHFERSGRQGIAITGAENLLVEDSYIGEVGRSIIDIEPNTANSRAWNITFTNNQFGPCRHLLLAAGGRGTDVGEIEISNNILTGMQLKVVVRASDGSRRGPFRIVGNESDTVLGSPVSALRFYRVDGVSVRDNIQPFAVARDMTAVQALESCGVLVNDNLFLNASQPADIETFSCPAR